MSDMIGAHPAAVAIPLFRRGKQAVGDHWQGLHDRRFVFGFFRLSCLRSQSPNMKTSMMKYRAAAGEIWREVGHRVSHVTECLKT
jgi:hypothetical protein